MSCWHFYLRRKFVPYLEGSLPPRDTKRLEKHILDCDRCRATFARLRAGHQLAQQLRQFNPEGAHGTPEFEAMMAGMGEIVTGRHRLARLWENWLYALTTPRVVQGLAALVLVLSALLVVSNRIVLFGERERALVKRSAMDFSNFHPLSIQEIGLNTQPHISTEGYVRDLHVDKEEGTVHFKLVEIPQGSGPFVVCEIISSIGMSLPREGSRVRVYGVARYDAQPGRNWHEVNPVMNIAVLKQ